MRTSSLSLEHRSGGRASIALLDDRSVTDATSAVGLLAHVFTGTSHSAGHHADVECLRAENVRRNLHLRPDDTDTRHFMTEPGIDYQKAKTLMTADQLRDLAKTGAEFTLKRLRAEIIANRVIWGFAPGEEWWTCRRLSGERSLEFAHRSRREALSWIESFPRHDVLFGIDFGTQDVAAEARGHRGLAEDQRANRPLDLDLTAPRSVRIVTRACRGCQLRPATAHCSSRAPGRLDPHARVPKTRLQHPMSRARTKRALRRTPRARRARTYCERSERRSERACDCAVGTGSQPPRGRPVVCWPL